MRESGNVVKLIANLVQTEPGEHCLFRAYGVSSVDSVYAPTRGRVTAQTARWYPDARIGRVELENVEQNGHFNLSVTVL
jgi:hypothetical protein